MFTAAHVSIAYHLHLHSRHLKNRGSRLHVNLYMYMYMQLCLYLAASVTCEAVSRNYQPTQLIIQASPWPVQRLHRWPGCIAAVV